MAYKLMRVRRDGTLGSLFINRGFVIPVGEWLEAEDHETKGYAYRPGWHCSVVPSAPHLKEDGRTWFKVEVQDYYMLARPKHQGGVWLIAQWMRVVDKTGHRI